MTTSMVGAKILFALKMNGLGIERFNIVGNRDGSFTINAIVTNNEASETEEDACVIKEDYRIRQINETP